MKISNLLLTLMFSISFLVSCDKGPELDLSKPQVVLEGYIKERFSLKSLEDREKLLQYTGGEVYERLFKMPDEEFKEVFLKDGMKFDRLKVLAKRQTGEDQAQITYEIRFKDNKDSKATVINKKLAVFRKQNKNWLITDAQNLKTAIEFEEETIEVPTTDSP